MYSKPYGKDPDSKVHGAYMGPTWVLLAPDKPHVGPMNLAIRGPGFNELSDRNMQYILSINASE